MLSALRTVRRRIVFTSLEKFDGSSYRPLTAAEVKQIAGRAGRFGSSYGRGGVTCMHQVCSADSSLALQSMHSVRRYAELMCIRPALAGCIEDFDLLSGSD